MLDERSNVATRPASVAIPAAGPSSNCHRRTAFSGDSLQVSDASPRRDGKFVRIGAETLWLRGVTYGTFRPGEDGAQFPVQDIVEQDFRAMAAHGLNAVRTYTVPPPWVLDCAARHGLRLMVGLPWEQHIAFLDDRGRCREIERWVRNGVASCAHHPAVLCYAVGNEIPASIVRFLGRRRVEDFIRRLYEIAKGEDPSRMATYVNYPSTEYLELPFLDLCCFNVFLENRERLELPGAPSEHRGGAPARHN